MTFDMPHTKQKLKQDFPPRMSKFYEKNICCHVSLYHAVGCYCSFITVFGKSEVEKWMASANG